MEETSNKSFAKWLETLQQESWQLELIISGFAIFLLLGAYEPLQNLAYQIELIQVGDNFYKILEVPYGLLSIAWYILVLNLIIHVLLRGLWISTIGLRYVSGDIDFDSLKFHPKFDNFLRRRIISFDIYIERLEKVCSIIFAFTFLIIFILITGGLTFGAFIIMGLSIDWINNHFGDNAVIPFAFLLLFFLFGLALYAIDFITLGWLKRTKRIARFYYPIYRFCSFITLSFIYRPLYYNLIDNKFGRWVGFLIIPYLITLIIISSLTIRSHAFLPNSRYQQTLRTSAYDDTSIAKNQFTYGASIPSKYVKNGFIELYLPYNPAQDDEVIRMICPDLKPAKTGTGFKGFFIDSGDEERARMNADSALICNTQRHQVFINDSLFTDLKYRFYRHPTRQNVGLITFLDVNYLPRGEHNLEIKTKFFRFRKGKAVLIPSQSALIPFWKE